ncbi:MAG TPA: hypothetical protein VFW84_04040 [Aquabacterium sp.]|uniref:hypothetical protein n=1 Tax=Aquabacterium sp. TaxID=1872578 RepID=UPI002E350E6A|nr:hypothetical protein [Aquabacterium sp.]HEX5371881.1 hypothetical protein [Aquabacterium sp.]
MNIERVRFDWGLLMSIKQLVRTSVLLVLLYVILVYGGFFYGLPKKTERLWPLIHVVLMIVIAQVAALLVTFLLRRHRSGCRNLVAVIWCAGIAWGTVLVCYGGVLNSQEEYCVKEVARDGVCALDGLKLVGESFVLVLLPTVCVFLYTLIFPVKKGIES